jgi:hypothetical protein
MSAQLLKAPTATSVKLINFTRARIVPGIVNNTWILIVEGTKPCLNMTVRLSPLIYVRKPEYWGIEVVGSVPGFCLPVVSPYSVSLPLDHIIGTKGIEVIGAKKRKQIDVPGASGGPVVSQKSKKTKKRASTKK